jgi:hypothetical protein
VPFHIISDYQDLSVTGNREGFVVAHQQLEQDARLLESDGRPESSGTNPATTMIHELGSGEDSPRWSTTDRGAFLVYDSLDDTTTDECVADLQLG